MLKDCLEIFAKKYEEYGEAYILDNYILADGTYLLINKEGEIEKRLDISKKNGELDRTDNTYTMFSQLDYYSKLIDMNKPIDSKKIIHSNNYLSFFVKKDNITSGKLTEDIINKYYEILLNPLIKYKNKSREIYERALEEYGEVSKDNLIKNREWILKNIFQVCEKHNINQDKNYLKIFFKENIQVWEKESNKYLLPNIYNSTDYNTFINGEIYGMPNDNIGLNSKKPYLKQKGRKNEIPYLISTKEVLLQKKFFDYLMNEASQGKLNIYIDDYIKCFKNNEKNKKIGYSFNGYFLRIQKGMEVEIKDFDEICNYNEDIKGCCINRSIDINYAKLKYETKMQYGNINTLNELSSVINSILFSSKLSSSYYKEKDKLEIKDNVLKQSVLQSREAFFDWFYKGNEQRIKTIFPKLSIRIIKNTICNGHRIKAQEQWMLREGVINYLYKGGYKMPDTMKEVLNEIDKKINDKEQPIIESDIEYALAVGQLVNYLISLSKSNFSSHAAINPILNTKSDIQLKEHIKKLFKKYNYAIDRNSRRFRNLYAMIEGYKTEKEISEDALLYGYLTNCLIYKKEGEGK